MRARLALFLAASLGLAACQGEDITPAATPMNTDVQEQDLLTLVTKPTLSGPQLNRLGSIRGQPGATEVRLARIAPDPARLLKPGSAVRVALAPGLEVVAAGESVQQRSADDISWGGSVRGTHGWVQMVLMDGGLTGTVTVGFDTYSIEPLGNGLHAITRIDQNALPPEHPSENPSGALGDAINAAAVDLLAARAPGQSVEVGTAAAIQINVMVVYTASAASAAGNIASKIQLAVDETNQGYANGGVNITMNRVHTAQVSYSESGRSFSTHVSNLRGTTDGQMDNVHTLRNTYGADVVVLVVNDSEACGIAAAIKATATTAFAVAHHSCITGYYSFAHEIGHLQGARHDRYVDGTLSPYQYGHGFIPSSKRWRTIMAYGNNCSNCTRINWWSNPLKTYPSTGEVMGTALYEDNARVLNLTAATVAAFR